VVTELAGVELEVSEDELRALCFARRGSEGMEPLADLRGEGARDPRFLVTLQLPELILECSDRLLQTGPAVSGGGGEACSKGCLSSLHFTNVCVEAGGKAGDYQGAFGVPVFLQLGVDSVFMTDLVTEGSAYPEVMRLGKAADGGGAAALHLRFEDRPPDSNASYLLNAATGGGLMVYSSPLATRIYRHLQVDCHTRRERGALSHAPNGTCYPVPPALHPNL